MKPTEILLLDNSTVNTLPHEPHLPMLLCFTLPLALKMLKEELNFTKEYWVVLG